MNANPKFLTLAGAALVAIAGAVAAVACSGDDNAAPSMPVLEAGSPGDDGSTSSSGSSGGSSSGSSSGTDGGGSADTGTAPACTPDGGTGATCNSCAYINSSGNNDGYNTCSSFGCQGNYNNTAHGVPSPLPTL